MKWTGGKDDFFGRGRGKSKIPRSRVLQSTRAKMFRGGKNVPESSQGVNPPQKQKLGKKTQRSRRAAKEGAQQVRVGGGGTWGVSTGRQKRKRGEKTTWPDARGQIGGDRKGRLVQQGQRRWKNPKQSNRGGLGHRLPGKEAEKTVLGPVSGERCPRLAKIRKEKKKTGPTKKKEGQTKRQEREEKGCGDVGSHGGGIDKHRQMDQQKPEWVTERNANSHSRNPERRTFTIDQKLKGAGGRTISAADVRAQKNQSQKNKPGTGWEKSLLDELKRRTTEGEVGARKNAFRSQTVSESPMTVR